MTKTRVRELDIRYWLPLLGVTVLLVATAAWTWLEYTTRLRDSHVASISAWHASLSRLQRVLNASQQDPHIARANDALLATFNDAPGLRHLAIVDATGTILHANPQELKGRPAEEVLPDFAQGWLDPTICGQFHCHHDGNGVVFDPVIGITFMLSIDFDVITLRTNEFHTV